MNYLLGICRGKLSTESGDFKGSIQWREFLIPLKRKMGGMVWICECPAETNVQVDKEFLVFVAIEWGRV